MELLDKQEILKALKKKDKEVQRLLRFIDQKNALIKKLNEKIQAHRQATSISSSDQKLNTYGIYNTGELYRDKTKIDHRIRLDSLGKNTDTSRFNSHSPLRKNSNIRELRSLSRLHKIS